MKDKQQISTTTQDTLDLIEDIILLDSNQKQQILNAINELKKKPEGN
jgi:hypothetical protein